MLYLCPEGSAMILICTYICQFYFTFQKGLNSLKKLKKFRCGNYNLPRRCMIKFKTMSPFFESLSLITWTSKWRKVEEDWQVIIISQGSYSSVPFPTFMIMVRQYRVYNVRIVLFSISLSCLKSCVFIFQTFHANDIFTCCFKEWNDLMIFSLITLYYCE